MPSLPGSAQEKQPLSQAVPQHTPWAHAPLWHSLAVLHTWPLPFLPHDPPRHTFGATQSASLAHRSAQRLPLQVNGAQANGGELMHAPLPLQVLGGDAVLVVELHEPALQTVPEA
ncbi:MAG: hypothetical protein SF187_26925 [Deltaproteobacteria bacterium]|nr:hypothetical protein [Deltaproteobacteria bacterium]